MHADPVLFETLIYLAAAVLSVPLSKALGLGSVVGYLMAGSAIGPWGLRLISDTKTANHVSEFGVVFLLFVIGLELKPSRLWSLRRAVFGLGAAQVIGTTALFTAVGLTLGLPFASAALVGIGLSLSSTAFAMQLLGERNQLSTPFGQTSFAILLFQDLAVIPLMAVLPLLAPQTAGQSAMAHPLTVAAVILGIAFLGGRVLKPLFRIIARARTKEIFTAATLLLVLGIALLMQSIGLSMELGAFLAGVVLADSEYRHELEADIEPFKGLLLGLFFISVGMTVDYGLLGAKTGMVAAGVVGLIAIKAAVLIALGKIAKLGAESSLNMAATISQGGEFAFVLFALGVQFGLLDTSTSSLLILIVTLSMAVTPFLVSLNDKLVSPRLRPEKCPFDKVPMAENPVLIAGYGRMGQIPARVLKVKGFDFTALEHDPEHVSVVLKYGAKIYYGDASRLDLLEAAGAKHAKIFILAIDDVEASLRTAEIVRQHFPHLKIFARARNREHAHHLMDLGITSIYREVYATSLEMTRDVLKTLGLAPERAEETVHKFREHDEKMLVEAYGVHKNEQELINFSKRSTEQLLELFRGDQSDVK